jgi:hypothetical protein
MKKIDLSTLLSYDAKGVREGAPTRNFKKRLPMMKLTLRILAVLIVVAGGAAAAITPKSAPALPSHQSPSAAFPIPGCGPGICPPNPPDMTSTKLR